MSLGYPTPKKPSEAFVGCINTLNTALLKLRSAIPEKLPNNLQPSEAFVAAINTLNATLLKYEEKSQKRHEEVMEKRQNYHEEKLAALWGIVKFMVRFEIVGV